MEKVYMVERYNEDMEIWEWTMLYNKKEKADTFIEFEISGYTDDKAEQKEYLKLYRVIETNVL